MNSLAHPGWLKKSGDFLVFCIAESLAFVSITPSLYLPKTALPGLHTALTGSQA